jgi:hypothetical protein
MSVVNNNQIEKSRTKKGTAITVPLKLKGDGFGRLYRAFLLEDIDPNKPTVKIYLFSSNKQVFKSCDYPVKYINFSDFNLNIFGREHIVKSALDMSYLIGGKCEDVLADNFDTFNLSQYLKATCEVQRLLV